MNSLIKNVKNEIKSFSNSNDEGKIGRDSKMKGKLNKVRENEDIMTFEKLRQANALLDKTEGKFGVDSFMIKKNDKTNTGSILDNSKDEKSISEFDPSSLLDDLEDDIFKLDTGL